MKINLEIIDAHYVKAPKTIEELNTKELVPKMVTRRRLTRASKIAIFLASKIEYNNDRIIYGTGFGELETSVNILNSISAKESISPTHFQNSVYNTAVSYLSMLKGYTGEIMTISSGDNTALSVLKAGAIKAMEGDTICLMAIETLDIDNIEEVNNCIDFLECGVVLKVKITSKESTLSFMDNNNKDKIPASLVHMANIVNNLNSDKENIIEINI